MRKPTSVEVMLLSAIALWALNLTVSRYILTHGFQPLSYSTVRYGLASLVFIAIALGAERSLRIERSDLGLVGGAALALFVNQIGFVYALKSTSASVIALILAATPIFAALIGLAFGTELLPRRFWVAPLSPSRASGSWPSAPAVRSAGTPSGSCSGSSLPRPGRCTRS